MLEDIVVIELASVLAGPAVGMFFAELGATVIKVENPAAGGDITRQWRAVDEQTPEGFSSYFCSVNWGKKSIALDAALPAGRQVLHALIRRADVVLASYRAGSAERLGMDARSLRKLNPDLIYARICGYAPEDERSAFDAIIQAASGFTFMNGNPDGPPTRMPVALMDLLAAHQLKEAVLLALLRRERGYGGSDMQVSLLQAGISSLANQATNWLIAGAVPGRIGSAHPNIAPYGEPYRSADKRDLVLAVGNDRQFVQLCAVLDCAALAQDVRFCSNEDRLRNRAALTFSLQERIGKRNAAELLEKLRAAGVPAEQVRSMPEVFCQPEAQEMLLEGKTAGMPLRAVRSIAFSGSGLKAIELSPPPLLNADVEWVREFIKDHRPGADDKGNNRDSNPGR